MISLFVYQIDVNSEDVEMQVSPDFVGASDNETDADEEEERPSPPIPHRQRPRSSSRGHYRGCAAEAETTATTAMPGHRGRALEKAPIPPRSAAPCLSTLGGTSRKRARLRLTEHQVIAKLSVIVSGGHPSDKYKTLERIGHGYLLLHSSITKCEHIDSC